MKTNRTVSRPAFDLSNIETVLRRDRTIVKKDYSRPWAEFAVDLIVGTFIAVLIVSVLVALFITWRAEKAEAAYTPTTNQEFCAEIAEGKWTVLDAPEEEVTALCAKYL